MTTNEQLKAFARLATPGKWDSRESRVYLANTGGFDIRNTPNALADARYIAFANPERILALIAENEQADKLLQQALEAIALRRNTGVSPTYDKWADSLVKDIRTHLEGKK